MKQLKDILNESLLDDADDIFNDSIKDGIKEFLKNNYDIKDYNISDEPDKDGKYIVDCKSVYIKNHNIRSLTNEFFKFGIISSDFSCFDCESLISLKGAPKEVKDSFDCSECDSLKTLKGAPEKVGWGFYCNNCNSLTSLKGAPKKINKSFSCGNCTSLKTLKDGPKEVGTDFNCSSCTSLKTLEGAPKVGGNFYCWDCSDEISDEEIEKYSAIKHKIVI